MEKVLSIIVPTYNTEALLPRCLDSLLGDSSVMESFEVLIVIDGSPDNSVRVAKEYAERYPNTFFVVEKENGGHGSTINKGLEIARGKYFKVLDSDDWFDNQSFFCFLEKIKNIDTDVILTDYVKEYLFEGRTEKIKLNVNPEEAILLDEIDFSENSRTLFAMARCAFKTELLKTTGLYLPEKMFYVDTILSFSPIYLLKTLHYVELDLYRYFIGRNEQSVSKSSLIRNRSHLNYVIKFLWNEYLANVASISSNKRYYFESFLSSLIVEQYFILNRLPFKDAKKELYEWDLFVKTTKDYVPPTKLIKNYRKLPYWCFRLIVH